jgi:hypothetical protein
VHVASQWRVRFPLLSTFGGPTPIGTSTSRNFFPFSASWDVGGGTFGGESAGFVSGEAKKAELEPVILLIFRLVWCFTIIFEIVSAEPARSFSILRE